jgi:hypothetical protein
MRYRLIAMSRSTKSDIAHVLSVGVAITGAPTWKAAVKLQLQASNMAPSPAKVKPGRQLKQ